MWHQRSEILFESCEKSPLESWSTSEPHAGVLYFMVPGAGAGIALYGIGAGVLYFTLWYRNTNVEFEHLK